jgi:hypothetical protein
MNLSEVCSIFSSFTHFFNLCVCLIFAEIINNYFCVKIFRAGIMLQESQHGLYGFAATPNSTPRRRARPAEEDTSVASTTTPSRIMTRGRSGRFVARSPNHADAETNSNLTSFASTATDIVTTDAECNVCTNTRSGDEQRFCQQCRKMLCVICCERMQQEARLNYFTCPYCNMQFVADVIDLFSD